MDCVSEESGTDEPQRTVPYDALRCPARKSSASASPTNDEQEPQEGSPNLYTTDCSFCSFIWLFITFRSGNKDGIRTDAQIRHFLFHEECQACSSPDGAQMPLCDFCKHLRLGHLVRCLWENPKVSVMSGLWKIQIDLDSPSRVLGRTKCDLCDFLTNAMSVPRTGVSEVEITLETSATLIINKVDGDLNIRIEARRGETTRPYVVFLNVDRHQATTNTLDNSKDFVQWDVVRRWMVECKENHKTECAYRSRQTVPPGFRVIDVNERCVVEREGFCEYLALSYVWGSRSESACYVEQATRDNIESLQVPGGLIRLPETIEDAIEICRNLGIKYLWVDRYCIVQDHAAHKHTQLSAMADIYSSSAITVIACSGDGVESGIPGVRRKRRWKTRSINIQALTISYESNHLDYIVPESIWNSRGWTYQEAALSERKLIMTLLEVWFQCRINTFREYNSDAQSTLWTHKLRFEQHFDLDYSGFMDYAKNLMRYTRRKLGFASDIYNAFDGIAQALYGRNDGFHFGLPEPHFDQALLWYCGCRWNDSRSRCLRACAETTPSWSWGSLTCGVVYTRFFCMTLVKWVLDKAQVSDMSSQSANAEAYGAHRIELKAMGEPDSWTFWRCKERGARPQLFLALAMNEGCIQAEKVSIPAHKNFESLQEHFTARWPTYQDAYNEVRQVDTRQSSGRNGVLFTKAQSAIFNIQSRWIQNANGMIIGRVYSRMPPNINDEADQSIYEGGSDPAEDIFYEECSNYQECCDDRECNVEGIALSISEARDSHIKQVVKLNNPDNSLEGVSEWDELYRDLTYFDCNDEPLVPIPRVNIMFISWEDGYARRIGLGWIALKQWSSFDWTLKEIWLK